MGRAAKCWSTSGARDGREGHIRAAGGRPRSSVLGPLGRRRGGLCGLGAWAREYGVVHMRWTALARRQGTQRAQIAGGCSPRPHSTFDTSPSAPTSANRTASRPAQDPGRERDIFLWATLRRGAIHGAAGGSFAPAASSPDPLRARPSRRSQDTHERERPRPDTASGRGPSISSSPRTVGWDRANAPRGRTGSRCTPPAWRHERGVRGREHQRRSASILGRDLARGAGSSAAARRGGDVGAARRAGRWRRLHRVARGRAHVARAEAQTAEGMWAWRGVPLPGDASRWWSVRACGPHKRCAARCVVSHRCASSALPRPLPLASESCPVVHRALC